jgi:hypothetical protein
MTMLRWLLVLWLVWALGGCAKSASPADAYGEAMPVYEADSMELAAVSRAASSAPAPKRARAAGAPAAAPPPPPPGMMAADGAPAPAPVDASAAAPAPGPRMVFYAGFTQLRVPKVLEAVDALSAMAAARGWQVERVYGNSLVLRVPVASFEESFAAVLATGEVVSRSVTADDITEAFTAVELRLRTARTARDRLIELLARATTEREKLALLREIQRLSEEVDTLEAQVRTLEGLAAWSRITVELLPREALAWQGPEVGSAAFAWIRGLSPFWNGPPPEAKRVALPVPTGFVALDRKGTHAESPDGARVFAWRAENAPLGDAAFWADALEGRLGKDFASVARSTEGDFTVLTFVFRGEPAYTWVLAVRSRGKHLDLVHAFLPTAEAAARHGEALRAALRAAAGGAA